jgi:hypothetical protein
MGNENDKEGHEKGRQPVCREEEDDSTDSTKMFCDEE